MKKVCQDTITTGTPDAKDGKCLCLHCFRRVDGLHKRAGHARGCPMFAGKRKAVVR